MAFWRTSARITTRSLRSQTHSCSNDYADSAKKEPPVRWSCWSRADDLEIAKLEERCCKSHNSHCCRGQSINNIWLQTCSTMTCWNLPVHKSFRDPSHTKLLFWGPRVSSWSNSHGGVYQCLQMFFDHPDTTRSPPQPPPPQQLLETPLVKNQGVQRLMWVGIPD